MHVGGLLFVSVLLALGSLVALLWIVRRMQRKTRTVAEAPATEAGRIRPKTRKIESRAAKSIFLFFIAAPYYPSSEN